ncbi:hypothetical protein HC928_12305 [bacterium]|nr:hypothetical protein [bacterium]
MYILLRDVQLKPDNPEFFVSEWRSAHSLTKNSGLSGFILKLHIALLLPNLCVNLDMGKSYRFLQPRLTDQLLISFGLSLLLAGTSSLGLNYYLYQGNLEQEVQQEAASITRSLQIAAQTDTELDQTERLKQIVADYSSLPNVIEVAILDANGNTVAHTDSDEADHLYTVLHPELEVVIQQVFSTKTEGYYKTTLHHRSVLLHILPFNFGLPERANSPGLAISVLDLETVQQRSRRSFLISYGHHARGDIGYFDR